MANGGSTQPGSAAAEPRANRPSWRPAKTHEGPRHQWQRQRAGETAVAGGIHRGRKWKIGVLLALAFALLGFLVWELLYAPAQTPVLVIAPTAYDWPLVPNSWAAEDAAGLSDLNHRTIDVVDLSSEWRSSQRGLARLDEALKKAARGTHRARSIVLMISMHGAVDGQSRPCLIPPGASPQDNSTWLTLKTVLEHIETAGLPAGLPKLLVLDTSRQPINWHAGQLAGGFVEGLNKVIEEAQIPNLAVLTSADASHASAHSPALRGSAFGHYLRLGLAGAADDPSASGNNNGRISLQELREYLARHVNAWTLHHHGRTQTPEVYPTGRDFDVAWSLRSSVWRNMVSRAGRIEPADPSINRARIVALWQKLDTLRAARPWRFDTLAWRQLEHRLLWLEQLAIAGKAYDERAAALAAELGSELDAAEQRLSAARQSGSLPAYAGLLSGQAVLPVAKIHSLPLAEFWGTIDRDSARAVQTQLDRSQTEPGGDTLRAALALADSPSIATPLDELNFLAICRRLHVPTLWPSPAPLAQVLRARGLAEKLATPPFEGNLPGDERAHAWVRPLLEPLDRSRRELEDAVILGPQKSGPAPAGNDLLATLENLNVGERAAAAFALRDNLWSELTYVARWACRQQDTAESQNQADSVISQSLLPLLEAAADLERHLDGSATDARSWTADSAAGVVQEKLEELKGSIKTTIDTALAATDSPDAVREIDELLNIPSLPWDTREQLVRQRLELHLKLAARYDGPFDSAPQTAGASAHSVPYAARVLSWTAHPISVLLGLNASTSAANPRDSDHSVAACAAIGDQVRTQLAALGASTDKRADAAAPPAENESRFRAAAALWFPRPAIDPVRERRRGDLQALFLWRAARALDDFYGPPSPAREPFFATSATDYLAAVRGLGPLAESLAGQAEQVDRRLAALRIAAREALAVNATDILLVEQANTVSSELVVAARTPESLADLPSATAAIFLADSAGRIEEQSRSLVVPRQAAAANESLVSQQTLLPSADLLARGPLLHAITTIRGNDFSAPVLLRAPGGAQVEFTAQNYGPPQITVLGHEQRRASVVFILDCSHSMQDQATIESPEATDRATSTRMEVAKRALNMLLADLAERGTLRVGVRLFGHRVGWSTTEAGKLLRQTNYAEEIPAELRPYADVEQILPLGRFDSIAAGRVFDRLQSVRAWGESPIYLALQHAIGDFGAADNSARSIVVITDGKNYQFNAPSDFQPALANVVSAAQRAQIAIQIVGFDLPESEARTAASEFTQIASRTGGSYVPVGSATALVDSLQRLLRPADYRVTDGSGNLVGAENLGTPLVLAPHRARRPYGVTFEGSREPVELAGGEAVELVVRRGEQRLEVVPYLKGSPRFEPLVQNDDGAATAQQVGIHRSLATREAVQFPFSIQHADGHFVPRPQEMWVEIAPLGLPEETSPAAFIFYDAPFAAGTTVPLANLVARQWPPQARKAEVRAWIKDSATAPLEERPLTDIADRLPQSPIGFSIPGAGGIGYQVRTAGTGLEPLVVGIVERHERAETVGSLKVTLAPLPRHATHQFDRANRVVLHTFKYDPGTAERSSISLQFTSRDAAQSHALRTSQPVIIDVSDRTDLLELTPAIAK